MAYISSKKSSGKFSSKAVAIPLATVLAIYSASAAAQAQDMSGFCFILNYFKQIVGAVAVLAIFAWVLGYFNKKSELSEIGQYIILGCVIAVAAFALVTKTGLIPPSC
jgi:ABC-type proline/glycine betaine transport system permease subunit